MEHIESHLDQHIEVSSPARIAVTSEYHFRHLFSSPAVMPLSQDVRRRRLSTAGADVPAGEPTLPEIAVRYCYTSGEAFARAFRAVHGVVPGEARRTGAAMNSQPGCPSASPSKGTAPCGIDRGEGSLPGSGRGSR